MHEDVVMDALSPGEAARTPEGFLRCWAVLAVPGVYQYPEKGYSALVPETTLSRDEDLQSLAGIDVNLSHPDIPITPETQQRFSIGAVAGPGRVVKDGEVPGVKGGSLIAPLIIKDVVGLKAIYAGARHISPQYVTEWEMTPGERDGVTYDRVQAGRKYQSVALLKPSENPRGGHGCRLLLPAEKDSLPPGPESPDSRSVLEGAFYKVAPDLEQSQIDELVRGALTALQVVETSTKDPDPGEDNAMEETPSVEDLNTKIAALKAEKAALMEELDGYKSKAADMEAKAKDAEEGMAAMEEEVSSDAVKAAAVRFKIEAKDGEGVADLAQRIVRDALHITPRDKSTAMQTLRALHRVDPAAIAAKQTKVEKDSKPANIPSHKRF